MYTMYYTSMYVLYYVCLSYLSVSLSLSLYVCVCLGPCAYLLCCLWVRSAAHTIAISLTSGIVFSRIDRYYYTTIVILLLLCYYCYTIYYTLYYYNVCVSLCLLFFVYVLL